MDVKSFRLQLAQALIGGYNTRQRYSLPAAIHEVAISRSTAPPVRRGEPVVSNTGHFPVLGAKAGAATAGTYSRGRRTPPSAAGSASAASA